VCVHSVVCDVSRRCAFDRLRAKRCHGAAAAVFTKQQRACDACVENYGDNGLWTPKRFEFWAIRHATKNCLLVEDADAVLPPPSAAQEATVLPLDPEQARRAQACPQDVDDSLEHLNLPATTQTRL
jgi:hypothetical protein